MAAPIIKQKKPVRVKPKPDVEEMSVIGHLEEFRTRLIKCVLALAVGTLISAVFTKSFLQFLLIPMGDAKPAALRVTETFVVYFRVALIGGFVLAMPIILYQIVRFILPGLLPSERRILYFMVPGGSFMFALGVSFATLIMLPFTVGYLKGFLSDLVQPIYSIDYYISFVTSLMFWIGIVFETPLVIFILAKVNLVTAKQLSQYRKFAVVGAFVIAAFVTPTPDPFNQALVAIPILLLYEFGVLLARLA